MVTGVPTGPLLGENPVIFGVTLNAPAAVATPPVVVTVIDPVSAPVGTVAVISESETTANAAGTPPNVTPVVCVRLCPLIVTTVPIAPRVGAKLETAGSTRYGKLLDSVPLGVTTWTVPVVALVGTVVVISEAETTVKTAGVPLKVTLLAWVRLLPRVLTDAPTLPEVV